MFRKQSSESQPNKISNQLSIVPVCPWQHLSSILIKPKRRKKANLSCSKTAEPWLRKAFSSFFIDIVYLAVYSHISREVWDATMKICTNMQPNQDKFPQASCGDKKKAREFMRCLLLSTLTSAQKSQKVWIMGFFSSRLNACHAMDYEVLWIYLFRSAYLDSTKFYASMGIDPICPKWMKFPSDQITCLDNNREALEQLANDDTPLGISLKDS